MIVFEAPAMDMSRPEPALLTPPCLHSSIRSGAQA